MADAVADRFDVEGAACVWTAAHRCMTLRGVMPPDARTAAVSLSGGSTDTCSTSGTPVRRRAAVATGNFGPRPRAAPAPRATGAPRPGSGAPRRSATSAPEAYLLRVTGCLTFDLIAASPDPTGSRPPSTRTRARPGTPTWRTPTGYAAPTRRTRCRCGNAAPWPTTATSGCCGSRCRAPRPGQDGEHAGAAGLAGGDGTVRAEYKTGRPGSQKRPDVAGRPAERHARSRAEARRRSTGFTATAPLLPPTAAAAHQRPGSGETGRVRRLFLDPWQKVALDGTVGGVPTNDAWEWSAFGNRATGRARTGRARSWGLGYRRAVPLQKAGPPRCARAWSTSGSVGRSKSGRACTWMLRRVASNGFRPRTATKHRD